jgi:uncharacterized protein YoxC
MITAYADDIIIIVDSNEKVNEIRPIFEQFEAVSGARLHLNQNGRHADWRIFSTTMVKHQEINKNPWHFL